MPHDPLDIRKGRGMHRRVGRDHFRQVGRTGQTPLKRLQHEYLVPRILTAHACDRPRAEQQVSAGFGGIGRLIEITFDHHLLARGHAHARADQGLHRLAKYPQNLITLGQQLGKRLSLLLYLSCAEEFEMHMLKGSLPAHGAVTRDSS